MNKILIATPLPSHTHPADSKPGRYFVERFAITDNWFFAYEKGPFVHCNRNALVKQMLAGSFTHILFWDADIPATFQHAGQLTRANKSIVSANHLWRGMPGVENSVSGMVDENENLTSVEPYRQDGIKEVDFVGTGFLCIEREVFTKIKYPWFNAYYDETFDPARFRGEDFYFCMKVRRAGYKIFCDYSCKLTH